MPYNPKGGYKNWSVKGIVLPFLIGNGSGVHIGAGVEYGFVKNHSISIDGNFFASSGTHDNIRDTAGVLHEVGAPYHANGFALFLSYRYYFSLQKLRTKNGIALYASCFYRYGQSNKYEDAAFKNNNNYFHQKETQNSVGFVLGSLIKFKNIKRLGFDMNSGIFYKQRNKVADYLEGNIAKVKHEKPTQVGMRLGLYIHYWFFIKKA